MSLSPGPRLQASETGSPGPSRGPWSNGVRSAFLEPCASCGCRCGGGTRSFLKPALAAPDFASQFLLSVLFQGKTIVVRCLDSDSVAELKIALCNSGRLPLLDLRFFSISDLDGAILDDRQGVAPYLHRQLDSSAAPPPSLHLHVGCLASPMTTPPPLGRQSSPSALLAAVAQAKREHLQEKLHNVRSTQLPAAMTPVAAIPPVLLRPPSHTKSPVVTPRAAAAAAVMKSLRVLRRGQSSTSTTSDDGGSSTSSASTSYTASSSPSPSLSRATSPAGVRSTPPQRLANPFTLAPGFSNESHSTPQSTSVRSLTSGAGSGHAGTSSSVCRSSIAVAPAEGLVERAENSASLPSRSLSASSFLSRTDSSVGSESGSGLCSLQSSAWLQSLPVSGSAAVPTKSQQPCSPAPPASTTPAQREELVTIKDISAFGFTKADMEAADQRCLLFSRPRKRARPAADEPPSAGPQDGSLAGSARTAGSTSPSNAACEANDSVDEPSRKRQRRWAPKEQLTFTGMYSSCIREYAKSMSARARWYDCLCGAFENPVQLSKLKQHVTSSSKIHRLYAEGLQKEESSGRSVAAGDGTPNSVVARPANGSLSRR